VALALPLVLMMSASYAVEPGTDLSPLPEWSAEYSFVGVAGCQMCHRSPAKGNQFGQWQGTTHSKAYERLASAEAKAVGAKVGVPDPQKSAQCLTCHVTGYDAPAAQKAPTWKMEDGVGCESCHGPGSAYKAMNVMRDHAQSMANGLQMVTKETCVKCHNEKNPTHPGFDYEAKLKLVAHPNPQK
jgi:predicted CxxxxCH...CXXCH cytochrome family protein